jgi:hypothetical protein
MAEQQRGFLQPEPAEVRSGALSRERAEDAVEMKRGEMGDGGEFLQRRRASEVGLEVSADPIETEAIVFSGGGAHSRRMTESIRRGTCWSIRKATGLQSGLELVGVRLEELLGVEEQARQDPSPRVGGGGGFDEVDARGASMERFQTSGPGAAGGSFETEGPRLKGHL